MPFKEQKRESEPSILQLLYKDMPLLGDRNPEQNQYQSPIYQFGSIADQASVYFACGPTC